MNQNKYFKSENWLEFSINIEFSQICDLAWENRIGLLIGNLGLLNSFKKVVESRFLIN